VPLRENHVFLLLDTEGLSSTERSTNIDIKIFALSVLLASTFIYNQIGPINETAIEDLSLVAELSKHVNTKGATFP